MSVEWLDAHAPFITVARLTLPRQDLDGDRGRRIVEFAETLSSDPWHALDEFRPLSNIMRARNYAYCLSTQERRSAKELDGTEQFD